MVVLCGTTLPARAEPSLRLVSTVTWEWDAAWFGGFSGLELSQDGGLMTVLSDRGMLAQVTLLRGNDLLVGLAPLSNSLLFDQDNTPLRPDARDVEGLAIAQDGTAYASFELEHRVARLNPQTGVTQDLPSHPDFAKLGKNTGLEALAVHPDGRLFTLSEAAADASRTTPLYAFDKGRWQITHRVPLPGPFRPVGADFDDQGRLYLLERTVTPLGFRTRVRRLDLNAAPIKAEVLLTSFPAAFDNLEGLSVWRDQSGATRLTLISDDNFFQLQTTQIVEFTVLE
jgi:hypothetical protein